MFVNSLWMYALSLYVFIYSVDVGIKHGEAESRVAVNTIVITSLHMFVNSLWMHASSLYELIYSVDVSIKHGEAESRIAVNTLVITSL